MKKITTRVILFLFGFFSIMFKNPAARTGIVARRSLLFLFSVYFLFHNVTYGQQVIGSFPEMEGGFENVTVAANTTTAIATGTQLMSWTGAHNSGGSTPAVYTDIVRTGTNSLQWLTTGSQRLLFTNSAASTAIQNASSYVIQFYWWKAHSSSVRNFDISISPAGTATLTTVTTPNLGVSAPSIEWTKQTLVITTGTNTAVPRYGLVQFYNNGGSIPSPGYLFDDFCVYSGSAVDDVAPGDVSNPMIAGYSSTSLNPSWTAPAGGTDGGGYLVIRYTNNPTSEPSPNINGIYAVGGTLGTGTIAYIGTATNFNDAGLSANTAYYYKVFTVDKAFNYSPDPTVFSGFTGIAGPSVITFTTPPSCITDRMTITWTGPLNYSTANNTLVAFLKQGSPVNAGTPTSIPGTYTESTVFGSGTAYQNDAAAYCIFNGDGTDAAGDHSGLTITGLTPGTTYYLLMYNIVDAGTIYSASTTGNANTLSSLGEPANNPTAFGKGAVTTSNIPLTWAAASGTPSPTGYLINASSSAVPADPSDFTDPANQTNISGGTANVKTNGSPYSSFTGFSAGTMYYFKINSYTNAGSCINFKAAGPSINAATLPNAVTAPALSITGGTGTINWSAATGYNNTTHTTLAFVSSAPITTGTPTSNPSIYTANTVFGAGTAYQLDANAKCVYTGDGTTATITGLVSGTTYYVLILTVVNAANYDATHSYSVYTTTSTSYSNANEYTWQGGATGDWQVAGNWNPARATPLPANVLIFNTAGNVTATNVPGETIAKLSINAGNVTLQSSGSVTLGITDNDGLSFTDLTVSGSTSLILGSSVSMTLGSTTTANIVGTLNVNNGNTYNSNGTNVVTTVAGTINNYGTVTSTTASKFVVSSGGTYNHGINEGTIPTGTWNTNSTCLVTGSTGTQNFSGHKQTFSKFVWDCAGQTHFFVLGENSSSTPPNMVITDSFIVKRTNGQLLQISSTGGQRDFVCGNYFQYGGLVTITYNTDASGEQRSLTVDKTFYVTDSLESNAKFQIINNPGGENIVGRLFVGGDVEMHPTNSSSTLERIVGGASALAEIWFNGSTAQWARFSTISGSVDFVTNQTGPGVTLRSNATANLFKLMRGTFFIASNTLTINNAVSYPSPGTGTIGGSSTSNLIMGLAGAAGTLNFASGSRTLKDFTQLANNTVSLGTELGITAGISPGRDSIGNNATLITNDNLILRSDVDGTSRMAQLPATATIIGKVAVERYLPMNYNYDSRRWRLLTAPFRSTNAPTINAAWQEGASCPDRTDPLPYDPKPGYGTHITKSPVWASDGYDQGSTFNPSIYYYSGGNWVAPANTNSVKITDNTGCYMLFARGNRSIFISNQYVAANPTTLDPKGELNIGNVTIPLAASGYQTVGNPYASEIKLDNIVFNDTLGNRKTIYLWDPKTLGSANVGKFITCSGDGNIPATYTYSANTSGFQTKPGVIESSGAFLIKGNGGNIVFHESDKTRESSTIGIASRGATNGRFTNPFGKIRKLFTDLLVMRGGVPELVDGVVNTYNGNYKNSIDDLDAPKLTTFTSREELSINKKGQLFAIERRKALAVTDTIFLNISKLNQAEYLFTFRPMAFANTITGFLVDKFTGITSVFSLVQNTSVPFSITEDPASAATDRFYIIFKSTMNAKGTITLKAALVDDDIALASDRTVEENESPLSIERSRDGKHFEAADLTPVNRSNDTWLDEKSLPGQYYYRIRCNDEDGKTVFSNIVKLEKTAAGINSSVSVYPNPVRNEQIGLQMGDLSEGDYQVRLINNSGQVLYSTKILYQNNAVINLDARTAGANGICKLEILSGKKLVAAINVLML